MIRNPDESIYMEQLNSATRARLDEITEHKHWDYHDFEKTLVVLAGLGSGNYVPAYNRPESIHLQGMRAVIDKLDARTALSGKEYARPIFADIESVSLVYGKTTEGTSTRVRVDTTKQPGREMYQRMVGSIHEHPEDGAQLIDVSSHGLSRQDYETFLSDTSQQFMVIRFGKNTLLALKTSVTPNAESEAAVNRHLADLEREFLIDRPQTGINVLTNLVDFNKSVCLEFGLTLYMATEASKDLATRVEVTK